MHWFWYVKREAVPGSKSCELQDDIIMTAAEMVSVCMMLLSGLTLILCICTEGMLSVVG